MSKNLDSFFSTPKKKKKKDKGARDTALGSFFAGEEEKLVVSDSPDATRVSSGVGKHGRKILTVELRTEGKYGVDGLHQGDLIREVVAARNIIPDWTVERWSQYVHELGRVPLWILGFDVDRYHKALYGMEVLREAKAKGDAENKAAVDSGMKYLPKDPNFNQEEYQEQYHGKRWGMPDKTDPVPTPVREQMAEKQAVKIDNKRLDIHEAPTSVRVNEPDEERWKEAEKIAVTMRREEWLGKFDPEFEARIRYCFQWLREIGEVPEYPIDPMDVYWQAETEQVRTAGTKTHIRRMKATRKVVKYWRTLVADERKRARTAAEDTEMNLHSKSYRTVLAAKHLHATIEAHARRTDDDMLPDVKKAAKKYFKAHFPIKNLQPGPMSTLDPEYHEYVVLCRKYNIKEGELLHKVLKKEKQ